MFEFAILIVCMKKLCWVNRKKYEKISLEKAGGALFEKKVEILLHNLFQPIVCGFLVWSISFGGCFLSLALKTL